MITMLLFRNLKLCSRILRSSFTQTTSILKTRYHILTKPNLTSKRSNNQRQFFSWFQKPTEKQIKQKDQIAPEFKLVYNTTLDKYMVLAQFAVVCSCGVLALIVLNRTELKYSESEETEVPAAFTDNSEIIYMTALIAFTIALQRLILKVPIRIYKSPQSARYVFVTRGLLPYSRKYFTCGANELRKVEGTATVIPWKEISYVVVSGDERRTVVLMDYYFKRPADLNILLGYQKEDGDGD